MKKAGISLSLLGTILFVCQTHVFCQRTKTLDSLFAVVNNAKKDTGAVKALLEIQRDFFNRGMYDSSYEYAHRALTLAKPLNHPKLRALAQYNIGLSCTNRAVFDSASWYLSLAQQAAVELKDNLLLAKCYNTFSMLYGYQSDHSTSLEYALKAAQIAESSKEKDLSDLLPLIYASIGNAFYGEGQWLKCIAYNKKALLFSNYPAEKRYRVILNLNITDAYVRLKQFDSARIYLGATIVANRNIENFVLKLLVGNTEGFYYQNINNYKQALNAYLKAYQYSDSCNNAYLKSGAADNIAVAYLKLKKYDSAFIFATESSKLALGLKNFGTAASAYFTLQQVCEKKEKYKEALMYAELSRQYNDSNTNAATKKATLLLETKYESQVKQKEIAELKIANAEKELTALKRNRIFGLSILGAFSIITFLILLYRNSNNKKLIAEKEQKLQREQILFLENQQQVLSLQSMVNGQEAERTRIAKDLHDGLGGLFSTVKMYLSTLEHEQKQLRENDLFKRSYALVDNAAVEVRRIAHNMMPEVLLKLGLPHALKDLCNDISASRVLQVSLQVNGMEKRLNAATEIMLYRIVQELLNNIVKHAHARHAIVQFIQNENRLSVTVEDDGMGFNTITSDNNKKAGIESVKSRVDYLKGNISFESASNLGTTVMMDFLIND